MLKKKELISILKNNFRKLVGPYKKLYGPTNETKEMQELHNKIKSVIFDLDGTLLDTSEGIISSVCYTIKQYGLPQLTDEKLRSFIGPPIQQSFGKIYGISDQQKLQEMADTFRNHYKEGDVYKAKPYKGIYQTLKHLKEANFILTVATYKREDLAKQLLYKYEFDKYLDEIFGSESKNKLTKPDIIKNAINYSCFPSESCAVVGDSDNDATGAFDTGANFIAVTYGFGFKTKSDVNEYHNIGVAKKPLDLVNILI